MDKVGRNDPCPCGSGKKFKKCCESKTKHKKIHAELLSGGSAKSMSSLFQRNVIPVPPSRAIEEEPKDILM
jgi:SEC-C motif-containing protein